MFVSKHIKGGMLALIATLFLIAGCDSKPSETEAKEAIETSKFSVSEHALTIPWSSCTTPGLPGECAQIAQADNVAIGGVICGTDKKCIVAPRLCTQDGESQWDCSAMYEYACFNDDNAKALAGSNPCVEPKCAFILSNADGSQNKKVGIANLPPRSKGATGYPSAFTSGKGACACTQELCDNGSYNANAKCTPPSAGEEVCGNKADDDCDGSVDEEGAKNCKTYYADGDLDLYGAGSGKCLCEPDATFVVEQKGDCADTDKAVNPKAVESCNSKDDNCDGKTDDKDATGCTKFFLDADADGAGVDDNQCLCSAAGQYTASKNGDCVDNDKLISPSGTESCNSKDDNCNGKTDETDATGCKVFYTDADGDTYGVSPSACMCSAAALMTAAVADDCADSNKDISPKGVESCNSTDDDCDGSTDEEDAVGCKKFYMDADGDTYGTVSAKCLCAATGQYTASVAGDCADTNKAINPKVVSVDTGAEDLCDGMDNDCNGKTDENNICGSCSQAEVVEVGVNNVTEATAIKIAVDTSALTDKSKLVKNWHCGAGDIQFLNAVGAEFAVRPKAGVDKIVWVKFIPNKTKTPIGSFQVSLSTIDTCGADVDEDGDGIKETVSNKVCLAAAPSLITFAGTGKSDVQAQLDGRATKTGLNPNGVLVGDVLIWATSK